MKIHEIYDVLKRIQGCTFASMDNVTQVKLKGGKKNLMQGRVTKHTKNNQVILFTNQNSNGYANMVREIHEVICNGSNVFVGKVVG